MANAQLLGKVDLLGLNAMGQSVGLTPLWGILIGGGVSNFTSMAVARTSKAKHAHLLGFLAGAAAGGALYAAGKGTRGAGAAAIATAFVTSGMKWLENVLFGAPATVAGMGLPSISMLGLPSISQLNGQMGLPSMSQTIPPRGAIPGVAGIQMSAPGASPPPVNLLGRNTRAGGPMISGLSAQYGATLLGNR
jgi:hypothetical protein